MTMKPLSSALFAAMLLAGTAGAAFAQEPAPGEEDLHHPGEVLPAPDAAAPGDEASGMPDGMPGTSGMMQMMTPEMMQMMQGMMAMMQQPGSEAGGPAMMGCPMMAAMQAGMDMDMGLGMPGMDMPGMMMGDAMLLGMPHGDQQEMTPERVRAFLEERLAWHGNPRLEIGEIATAEDGSVTAEIVTVDGSSVQRLAFNRYPGLFRQITE
jgi:hypothetical protein